jgi:hypothetical protein
MQNWLGAVFVAFTALIIGVQVGRRGLAGAFRPVPLLLAVSSLILVLRLREVTGLSVTTMHLAAAIALFAVGAVMGRSAGPPRIRDAFADEDDSYSEMYRQAGMSPEVIEMERKFRQTKREIAAQSPRVHIDRTAGFSIEIPSSWQPAKPVREFVASGGRLAIAHVTRHATLNVSHGPPDEPRLADPDVREATLLRIVTGSGYDQVVIGRPAVSGETNVVRGDWIESDGGHAGLMSIVHDGSETVLQWKAGPDYIEGTLVIVDSFRML